MLERWDAADEEVISEYESATIRLRGDLNRLAATYRRRAAEEIKGIEQKVNVRRKAAHQHYEARKARPAKRRRAEHNRIAAALRPVHRSLEDARSLTVARLDYLPQVPAVGAPLEAVGEVEPQTLEEAIAAIGRLADRCRQTADEMHAGLASRIVDRHYLPAGVIAFVALWSAIAYGFGPSPPWLAMAVGVPIGAAVGFLIYLILQWPLKKMTRQLYPQVERIAQAAERCASVGRTVAGRRAEKQAAELVRARDEQLAAADRWRADQVAAAGERLEAEHQAERVRRLDELAEVASRYGERSGQVGYEMRRAADAVAASITEELSRTEADVARRRDLAAIGRKAELRRLEDRLRRGVRRGIARMRAAEDRMQRDCPSWDQVLAQPFPLTGGVDSLPVGRLEVRDVLARTFGPALDDNPAAAGASAGQHSAADGRPAATNGGDVTDLDLAETLPVSLHRRRQCGLVITAPAVHLELAVDAAHQVLWRLLAAAPPGRAKLTLIDPLGRGQNFTSFMALADHDASLVGHRVWTAESKIETRLAEVAHHVEDVLQASLRDRFERIEDYNELAGSMAEPYRAIAAVGFPDGLSREGYKHLRALLESGLRCGVFTILVCDEAKPWPDEMPLPQTDKLLRLRIDQSGRWRCQTGRLDQLELHPAVGPTPELRERLIEKIGGAAVAAAKVEIPLGSLLPRDQDGCGSTSDGLEIAVGSQGPGRTLSLKLGEGVRQHVLIAGKTGSGKSTLLHSMITSGAFRFRPDELEFYLLDFKKGVEFKPYADTGLPHARVIGIESEREFGRSVLQRLDAELQHRGEAFRAAGVQELGRYREIRGEAMPRVVLVVDEFQELFVRDDRLAADCAMLLDRLVRQGRSFGIHVVLSSQSLAGAYSLPRATLGQMAVRIALQCSEADAALILADDNTAARLISRPGEAIYNDAGGLVEGNHPFQVAWLCDAAHREMLETITRRDRSWVESQPPPVVFEGHRPCRWTPSLADSAWAAATGPSSLRGLLGESVEIGPPVTAELTPDPGRNVLLIAPAESRGSVTASLVTSVAKQRPGLRVVYFEGRRADDGEPITPWLTAAGVKVESVKLRDGESEMTKLAAALTRRTEQGAGAEPVLVVIDPLERFREFRQDDAFQFSLDAAAGSSGPRALQTVLRDGPTANVFSLVICGSAETLSRWLPRTSQHDLELRVLGRINASDSALLVDSPVASELSAATMLVYDDAEGRVTKFRPCDLPDAERVQSWLQR